MSPADLERLADDEGALLRALTGVKRGSLTTGYLRFRLDRPALVTIAVPAGPVPFWLREAGFMPTAETVGHPGGPFTLWSRKVGAGMVGLGVNSLDRRARGHYLVFVRGTEGRASIWALIRVSGRS